MTLSDKLRSAAKSPAGWDVPGLLEDAANTLDSVTAGCEELVHRFESIRSVSEWRGHDDRSQQPLTNDEMIEEARLRG